MAVTFPGTARAGFSGSYSRIGRRVRENVRLFLEDCLVEGVEPGRVLHIALPAPRASLEKFLASVPRHLGVVWYPKTGTAFACIGAACRIDVRGPDRFVQLRAQVDALWQRLDNRSYPGLNAPSARVFGGLAFAPGVNDAPPWTDFSDGCFTLPRWCYGRCGDVVFLSLAIDAGDLGPDWRAEALAEYDEIIDALNSDRAPETFAGEHFQPSSYISREAVTQLSFNRWQVLIADIHDAIRRGEFAKIVAARRSHVESSEPFDDVQVLSRLALEYKACYRFAFRREQATFLGASPERLFLKRGVHLDTQALAGTISSGCVDGPTDVGQSQRLLNSQKDLAEHYIVVHEVLRQLRSVCAVIAPIDPPQIRRVRNLLHLNTPISGELRPDVHAIDILARLHPTPAVGGLPSQNAVSWITEHEDDPRGWYAGPVGWLGADGDAEFVVAIRSGVVCGTDAFIYAGAGVVRDSTAEREYFETEIKQEPLFRALGVEP